MPVSASCHIPDHCDAPATGCGSQFRWAWQAEAARRIPEHAARVLDAVPARAGDGPVAIAVSAGVDLDTAIGCLGALAAGGFVDRCDTGWRLRPRRPD